MRPIVLIFKKRSCFVIHCLSFLVLVLKTGPTVYGQHNFRSVKLRTQKGNFVKHIHIQATDKRYNLLLRPIENNQDVQQSWEIQSTRLKDESGTIMGKKDAYGFHWSFKLDQQQVEADLLLQKGRYAWKIYNALDTLWFKDLSVNKNGKLASELVHILPQLPILDDAGKRRVIHKEAVIVFFEQKKKKEAYLSVVNSDSEFMYPPIFHLAAAFIGVLTCQQKLTE